MFDNKISSKFIFLKHDYSYATQTVYFRKV